MSAEQCCLCVGGANKATRSYWTGRAWSSLASMARPLSQREADQLIRRRFHRLRRPPVVLNVYVERRREISGKFSRGAMYQ